MVEAFVSGLIQVLSWPAFGFMMIGMAIGWFVGILPGLGGVTTLALMLPFIYTMSPVGAMAFLLGMKSVTSTTGDITSVLFGVPGEGTSTATIIDGYQMTRKGEAGRALGIVLGSSLMGALVGAFALAAIIPVVRPLVLMFAPPEYFLLILVGITFITAVAGRSVIKGFVSAGLGFLVSMVGLDAHHAVPRYTFGWQYLWDGVDIITVALGLFAVPAIIEMAVDPGNPSAKTTGKITGVMQGFRDVIQRWWLTIRCSLIGVYIGIVPGIGGGVAQWVSYAHAVQGVKDKRLVGHGAIEGVIGPGAANNATQGGDLVPTIAFGVPGSVPMAILLGAFIITGLVPGPEMLTTKLDVTFSMMWTMVIANIVVVLVTLPFLDQVAKITRVKSSRLIPFILMLVFLGAFAANNDLGDLWMMLGFGALGWTMVKLGWPLPPMALGAVMGGLAENNLWISVESLGATWLTRPMVILLFAVAAFGAIYPFWERKRAGKARSKAQLKATETDEDAAMSGAALVEKPDRTGSGLSILFTLFLAVLFAWAVIVSRSWPPGARLFPWIAAVPAFLLVVFQLTRELRQRKASPHISEAKRSKAMSTELRVTAKIAAWTFGLFAGIWLLGFIIAIALFVFLFLKMESREKWFFSLLGAAGSWAFIYALFVMILNFPFPDPQLFFWLGF